MIFKPLSMGAFMILNPLSEVQTAKGRQMDFSCYVVFLGLLLLHNFSDVKKNTHLLNSQILLGSPNPN